MSDLRKAAQMALEALEGDYRHAVRDDAIDALRAALAQPAEKFCDTHCVWTDHHPDCDLAQPEPEPFGYLWPTGRHPEFRFTQQKFNGVDGTPVYTAPPQRKPLTDEEIAALSEQHIFASRLTKFVRAIERAHGIGEHNV